MRARVGKIARLPEPIREQLNQRLGNGCPGRETVIWLNELPEVKRVVAERFAGRPITEHNVSEWRHGGHEDWLREKETRTRVLQCTEKYQHLESEARLGRRVESMMIAQLVDAMDQLRHIKDHGVRLHRLQRITRELARLQNVHCRGLEVQLLQEKAAQTSTQATSKALGASRTLSDIKHSGGGYLKEPRPDEPTTTTI